MYVGRHKRILWSIERTSLTQKIKILKWKKFGNITFSEKYFNNWKLFTKSMKLFTKSMFKGHLRYKTIISQNLSSKAQVNFFFVWSGNYIPFSRYSSFCILNYPALYEICDVMMIFSTQDMVHFSVYLLSHNSLRQQIWSIDRRKQG